MGKRKWAHKPNKIAYQTQAAKRFISKISWPPPRQPRKRDTTDGK